VKRMRGWCAVIVLTVGLCVCAGPAAPQIPQQQQPPPASPAGPGESSSEAPPPVPPASKTKPKKNVDSAVNSAPDQPVWDPQRAEKDLEVGKYYERKGDIDAAIDRYEDATIAKPGYAIPYRYLGAAYEKKGKKKPAVKAYQKYLDLYPHAEDGEKIRKKIEKLHEEIDKEKSARQ
jgi:tetratricopeptide (TPR) repeat protein